MKRLFLAATLSLALAAPPVVPANLTHALSLADSITVGGATLAYINIYADAPDYRPVMAPGEGLACVDDAGRFLEVLEYAIVTEGRRDLLPLARGVTRFLLYLSRPDGLWNNFIYSDGTINTTHRNSRAEFSWWAVRGLRGLAAADRILAAESTGQGARSEDLSGLAAQVARRIAAADVWIDSLLAVYPRHMDTPYGPQPAWLLNAAPDQTAELLLVLAELQRTGRYDYRRAIAILAEGLLECQVGNEVPDLCGMYRCWENTWHNWGNNQAYALLRVYQVTGDTLLLNSVRAWADGFVPFLLEHDYPMTISITVGGAYKLTAFSQIAYGFDSIYRGLRLLADITGSAVYRERSEQVFGWFTGANCTGRAMYDPATGRCYDGINGLDSINFNSGAESTLECLLAVQARIGR